MGTPPSFLSPARNKESSARARALATEDECTGAGRQDERTGAGGPDRRTETDVCGGAEGDEEMRNGMAEGREAGARAASSTTTSARDCAGPRIGVASLSGSSRPSPRKAGPDDPERKGRPPNGEPRAGAAGREGAESTAGVEDTAGAECTAGAEDAAGAGSAAGKVDCAKRAKMTAPIQTH